MTEQTVLPNGVIVTKSTGYGIRAEYRAWEPDSPTREGKFHNHSSITSNRSGLVDGPSKWYGTIATRDLPPEIEALPVGPVRTVRVRAFHEVRYQVAYDSIIEAYPEAAIGSRSMGWITIRDVTQA